MGIWLALGSASGVAAAVIAVFALLRTARRESGTDHAAALEGTIKSALGPFAARIDRLDSRTAECMEKVDKLAAADARVADQLVIVASRIAVLEAKMDVFWKNVALDAARVLHSPHPGRERADQLLEAFMNGTITKRELRELRGVLEYVRDYHGGDNPEFPVSPGEQVAAAILLRTMEYVKNG